MDLFELKEISPMLLGEEKQPFDDPDSICELKLDGIRCIAYLGEGKTVLRNKRNKDVSALYPELAHMYRCAKKKCILDGELVAFTGGKPDFYALQRRSLMADPFRIALAAERKPISFVAYDILYCGGRELTGEPLLRRKAALAANVEEGHGLSISRYVEGRGVEFFALAAAQGLEGVVIKRKNGLYHSGRRTRDWIKVKVMQDEDLLVCGYQADGEGNVKDLILGRYGAEGKLECRGKVYLGVSREDKRLVEEFARGNTVDTPWFPQYKNAVWLVPALVGTVHFMQETANGALRQPVFKGIRPDG